MDCLALQYHDFHIENNEQLDSTAYKILFKDTLNLAPLNTLGVYMYSCLITFAFRSLYKVLSVSVLHLPQGAI